jgi:hypothetical protein
VAHKLASKAPVFEKIYQDYLARVAGQDLTGKQDLLGIEVDGQTITIPFFNATCSVSPQKIVDHSDGRPPHAVCVILCQYLLLSPDQPDDDRQLVTYRDFKDAAPYVQGFDNTAQKPISRAFAGRIDALEARCRHLGGTPCDIGISCDLSYMFEALPRVRVYLVFNDADEDFPADCSILFEKQAARYLDMECLAMIAMGLAEQLAGKDSPDMARLA